MKQSLSSSSYTLMSALQYQFANFSNPKYAEMGTGLLKLQLINQRADFSLALFTDGLVNV